MTPKSARPTCMAAWDTACTLRQCIKTGTRKYKIPFKICLWMVKPAMKDSNGIRRRWWSAALQIKPCNTARRALVTSSMFCLRRLIERYQKRAKSDSWMRLAYCRVKRPGLVQFACCQVPHIITVTVEKHDGAYLQWVSSVLDYENESIFQQSRLLFLKKDVLLGPC